MQISYMQISYFLTHCSYIKVSLNSFDLMYRSCISIENW